MKSSKLKLTVIVVLIFVAGSAGLVLLTRKNSQNQELSENSGELQVEEINTLPVKQRPFTRIYPRKDGLEVTIVVDQISNYDLVEYELEYQAGTLLQGAFGKVDFEKDQPPVERNILLGSCSAGGACSYHKDVHGGTLLLRYRNSDKVVLKSEWNFQQMSQEEGVFTSRDAKFSFDVGRTGLPASTFVIVSQSLGLPEEIDGEVVGGPYTVAIPSGMEALTDEITLSMRTSVEAENVKLMAWTESGWQEYESEMSGKMLTASVDLTTTFVAIQGQ